jgi:transposase
LLKYVNPDLIVYVDESGIDNNENVLCGYSLRGTRCYGEKPGHKTTRISIIGGLCKGVFIAPMTLEGSVNTAIMQAWVDQVLVPILKPGQIIIWDNASFHKSPMLKKSIESAGCDLWFLPTYAPDLNLIEHYWFVLKNKKLYSQLNCLLI